MVASYIYFVGKSDDYRQEQARKIATQQGCVVQFSRSVSNGFVDRNGRTVNYEVRCANGTTLYFTISLFSSH
ncbi:MAG: hypothetical protein WBC29_00845 [Candidatus Moraniibacteriota bacterium]